MTSLVTALYDIGRGEMENLENNYRPFSYYIKWFEELLKIQTHLIIFIPPKGKYSGGYDLEQFIKEKRKYPTTVIIKPFEELELYSKKEIIAQNQKLRNLKNIEFINPDYIITIFSKFKFILDSLSLTDAKHLFWIDAGFFRDKNLVPKSSWPSPEKLDLIGDNLILDRGDFHDNILLNWNDDVSKYCNDIYAYFFGGVRKTIVDFSNKVLEYFETMLDRGLINNEQRVMSRVIREGFPAIVLEKNGRKIVKRLSSELNLGLKYPLEKRLLLLTVASREVSLSQLEQWEKSAQFYGYNYEILGRDKKWGGWIFRTNEYLQRIIQEQNAEIIIISDGTDLYFNGPAREAYEKFTESKKDVIIGVEQIIAYSKGRHDIYEMEDFFNKKSNTVLKYPNGGFVIGKRKNMIELLTLNKDNIDDQAGYMDIIYEGLYHVDLDMTGQFVGNFPNLGDFTNHFCSIWKYDKEKNRYYNSVSKEYPVALHFPGGNTGFLNKTARSVKVPETIFSRSISEQNFNSDVITFFIGFLLIIAIFGGIGYMLFMK